jgi:hypothetical protein
MSLGHAEFKNNFAKAHQSRLKKIRGAYESARKVAEQSLDANTPEDTGKLKESNKVKLLESGIGFVMSSFGNLETGRAYAGHVNSGHHIALKGGGLRFVPPQPYFSQAEADARAELLRALRSR